MKKIVKKNVKNKSEKGSVNPGIKKQYLKSKPMCKVTFRLSKQAAPEAKQVTLVGDFNDWDTDRNPMKRLKSGDFTLTIDLPSNGEYNFKYLIDESQWENDWNADKYVPNEYGEDNSVVVI